MVHFQWMSSAATDDWVLAAPDRANGLPAPPPRSGPRAMVSGVSKIPSPEVSGCLRDWGPKKS